MVEGGKEEEGEGRWSGGTMERVTGVVVGGRGGVE